jgi:hypothetical protein
MPPAQRPEAIVQTRHGFWLKHLTRWHWISSAISLIGLILFSITGITLNHAADIDATTTTVDKTANLPAALMAPFKAEVADGTKAPLPEPARAWAADHIGVQLPKSDAEWSSDEVYLALPRPGGDAWLSVDRESGEISYEKTDRGWIAWLNDLHKGRNTGGAWRWFLDIFAGAALVFSTTGLFLLQLHGRRRPATWPLVGLGLLIPVLLILLFLH